MKQELTCVREELKALEKEKCLIINKINSIKHQYKEAKESVQNAEEVLTYTNRAIHNTNYNNSLRASMVSSSSKYLKAQESRVNTESNQRLNTENSVSNFKNSLNKDTMNFYNLTINKNEDANIEEADNVSKEIWSRVMSKHKTHTESLQNEIEESPQSKPKRKIRSPDKENECVRSSMHNDFSISLNKIPTSLLTNGDSRMFKIDLNKMQKQYDEQKHQNFSESLKVASCISDVTNLNPSFPIENNFETFNREPKANNLKIEDCKAQDLLVEDFYEVECKYSKDNKTDQNMFNSSLHCLREKQIPNQNNTQIHNKSFRLQKQLKEFNYSSALTDSSCEENPNKRKQQKYKLNKKEYSREQRSRGNSYLHQSNLQSELSNHQNSLSINMLSGDVNNCSINSNFMLDTKMVPKIKLNTIVEKPKYSHSKGTVVKY